MKSIALLFLLVITNSFYSQDRDSVKSYNISDLLVEKHDSLGVPVNRPWTNLSESYYSKQNDSIWILLDYDEANGDQCGGCEHILGLIILNKNDTGIHNINDVIDYRGDFKLDKTYEYSGFVKLNKLSKKELTIELNFTVNNNREIIIVDMVDEIPNHGYNKKNRKYSLIYKWFILNNY